MQGLLGHTKSCPKSNRKLPSGSLREVDYQIESRCTPEMNREYCRSIIFILKKGKGPGKTRMAKGWRKQWRWARADMKARNSATTIGGWASADGDLDQHSGRGHGGR